MMKPQLPLGCLFGVLGGLAASVSGCVISPDGEVLVPEEAALHTDAVTQNAVTQNAVTQNAVTQNAVTQNAVTQNALMQGSLALNGPLLTALEDPSARQLFTYIVSCALPQGTELSYTSQGTTYAFPGALGLAPDWGEPGGVCDESCQQWVSACVLSRVNYLGQHVSISVRGDNPGLFTTLAERAQYPHREAAYYGNIFTQPQELYGCLAPGQSTDPRVCGPGPVYKCFIKFAGMCNKLCDPQRPDGSFPNCHAPGGYGEGYVNDNSGKLYHETVTVFLQ